MSRILKAKIKSKNNTRTVRLGNVKDVGVGNTNRFTVNFKEINLRIDNSRCQGFHIESISLQLQLIDLWLRELVKEITGEQFTFKKKQYFGDILKKSKNLLSPELYEKITDFNIKRIDAIHKFIYGGIDYQRIEDISNKYNSLHKEVFRFVVKEIDKKKP